jgi:hypothetical protein
MVTKSILGALIGVAIVQPASGHHSTAMKK